jgi:hypothetical protein
LKADEQRNDGKSEVKILRSKKNVKEKKNGKGGDVHPQSPPHENPERSPLCQAINIY